MKIIFETLTFKNVLSYGNIPTTFNFKNGIDLVVGENGKGKSTFVDALTYGLFGKPFRKIKISNLVNNKNNKGLYVEVTFLVNDNRFKIIRGQKPDKFEIYKEEDGSFSLVEKPSTNRDYQILLEDNILQFGENVYRQLIALGANLSSSKNFMDLSKNDKEEVLQVITDTVIFNDIKNVVREKKLIQKTSLTEFNYKIAIQTSTISSLKSNILMMEKQNKEFTQNKDKILSELNNELFDINNKLVSYSNAFLALDSLQAKMDELSPFIVDIENKLELALDNERDLKTKSRKLISNEKNKTICPSCEFEIKEELPFTKEELVESLELIELEKNSLQTNLDELLARKNGKLEKLNNRNRLESNERELLVRKTETEDRIKQTSQWETVDIDYSELEIMEAEFSKTKDTLIQIKNDLSDLNDLEEMVSDKNLKGVILDQQLPFLNKYVNEFLELFDSKFNFVIDSEFKEKIISRNADNDFNSLSNGQKQRISLSILFAFLKLIEEKNGISTNLLILDEYLDSSLDIEGIDEVMSILDEVFSNSKDVVLISHNPDIKNRLELLNRIIKVENKDGFSVFDATSENGR